jgi:hypothetical protein
MNIETHHSNCASLRGGLCNCAWQNNLNQRNAIENPPHYNNIDAECGDCKRKIECIDVTRHMSFNLGNAMKYIWRCDHKGNAIEDLKKAIWYLEDEIKMRGLK